MFHPLGLRPMGNKFVRRDVSGAKAIPTRRSLLGVLNHFTTQTLIDTVLEFLDPKELAVFSQLSTFTYSVSYAVDESLWRRLALCKYGEGNMRISGIHPGQMSADTTDENSARKELTWRRIFAVNAALTITNPTDTLHAQLPAWALRPTCIPVRDYLFDDDLFKTQLLRACDPISTCDELQSLLELSEGLPTDTDATGHNIKWMSREERPSFERFDGTLRASGGTPTIVQGIMSTWDKAKWSRESFTRLLPEEPFLCGQTTLRLRDWLWYGDHTQDETPLFIFCPDVLRKPQGSYLLNTCADVPKYWSDEMDAFKTLPIEIQPKNRWILWGKQWTGSKWHQDPNGTEAWNAVFKGRKLWLFSPPHLNPPGVTKMGEDVMQPESLREWFEHYFETACKLVHMQIGIQQPGEVIYVPQKWWHCVLNIDDDTIAITGNLAPLSEHTMPNTRYFMKNQKDSISGVPRHCRQDLWSTLDESIRKADGGKWSYLVEKEVVDNSKKKSLWASLMEDF